MTDQPREHCGNLSPQTLLTTPRTECVLRPDHQGSHADDRGCRWWAAPAPSAAPLPPADLPARLEATLTERYTELGNPFSRMRRQEQGPDGWPAEHPVGPHHVAEVLRELLADETQPAQPEPDDHRHAAALHFLGKTIPTEDGATP
ncbi:hypothetical protein ACFYQA_08440 [Streptomyces sp. NPDC005774]|uniref:hypothetical protein n=1 Tax=Streptomyces sp. NPDC005774 TaxID=3364728 RepID=UPI0036CC6863